MSQNFEGQTQCFNGFDPNPALFLTEIVFQSITGYVFSSGLPEVSNGDHGLKSKVEIRYQ